MAMNSIIVPIDFSDASMNALSFAAEMAKRASAQLQMVHVVTPNGDESDAASKLEAVEQGLRKTFGADLACGASVRRGNFIAALQEITDFQQPDMIVMGTKGASGLKRILIGSNTVNLIAHTKSPVFVIPEEARFENFIRNGKNRIVLATDLDDLEDESALDVLKEIALLIIDPKIWVVNVRPKKTELDYMKQMARNALLSAFSPEIATDRATVFSGDVVSGINFYLNEHPDAGLVAMIARDSGQLIQKHYTREMASHTHLPLLVLHDVKA